MPVHEDGEVRAHVAQLARLEMQLASVASRVDAIDAELGGVPRLEIRDLNRKSVRDRLHQVEGELSATKLYAEAAKAASETMREMRGHTWSIYEKVGLFLLAFITTCVSVAGLIARLFGLGG